MQDLDVTRCENCDIIVSGDFTNHKICEECLYIYCIRCIHIMFGDECVCKDCSKEFNKRTHSDKKRITYNNTHNRYLIAFHD
jgi:hypothetical protein